MFNEAEEFRDSLDNKIRYWRKVHKEARLNKEVVTQDTTTMLGIKAGCYIDAYQTVRKELFGETLPEEKADD